MRKISIKRKIPDTVRPRAFRLNGDDPPKVRKSQNFVMLLKILQTHVE